MTDEARSAAQKAVLGRVDKIVSTKEVNQRFLNLDRTGMSLFGRAMHETIFVV